MSDITIEREGDGRIVAHGLRASIRTGTAHGALLLDSMEQARALAHAILDADRHPMEAKPLARVEIIDVAAHAREVYGREGADLIAGRPLPEHDYRFRSNPRPSEGDSTYGVLWAAGDIMRAILRDRELRARGL